MFAALQVLEHSDGLFSEPPFLLAEQTKFSQSILIWQAFQSSDRPSLGLFQPAPHLFGIAGTKTERSAPGVA